MNFKIITLALLFKSPTLLAHAEKNHGSIRKAKENSAEVSLLLGEDENSAKLDHQDVNAMHEETPSHLNKVDADSRQLQRPSRQCITHTVWHPFKAAHGTCRDYLQHKNYCYVDKNTENILAKDACQECDVCTGPNRKCIAYSSERPFDANYGQCDTYAPGQKNSGWCAYDVDANNIRANQVCSECGGCEKSKARTVKVTAEYLKCENENDGLGNAEEIYGYLHAKVGGETQILWNALNKVSIEENKSHYISKTLYFSNVGDMDYIILGGHLKEEDFFRDDDLGYRSAKRLVGERYGQGKTGVKVYWTHGGTRMMAYYYVEVY